MPTRPAIELVGAAKRLDELAGLLRSPLQLVDVGLVRLHQGRARLSELFVEYERPAPQILQLVEVGFVLREKIPVLGVELCERTLAKLDAQYRDFLSQHKADLDELEDLRRRALVLDEKLGQARTALVQTNKTDIDELKRTSQQARELVETLRSSYELDRRSRRQ